MPDKHVSTLQDCLSFTPTWARSRPDCRRSPGQCRQALCRASCIRDCIKRYASGQQQLHAHQSHMICPFWHLWRRHLQVWFFVSLHRPASSILRRVRRPCEFAAMMSALKQAARPAATRGMLSPASALNLSSFRASPSSPRREAQQSQPRMHLAPNCKGGMRGARHQHSFSKTKAQASGISTVLPVYIRCMLQGCCERNFTLSADSWHHSSKTVSAADSVDLNQESEIDSKAFADG